MEEEYPPNVVNFVILQMRSGETTASLMQSDIPNGLVSRAAAARIREDVTGEEFGEW